MAVRSRCVQSYSDGGLCVSVCVEGGGRVRGGEGGEGEGSAEEKAAHKAAGDAAC